MENIAIFTASANKAPKTPSTSTPGDVVVGTVVYRPKGGIRRPARDGRRTAGGVVLVPSDY